ncbi:MFS transporter [Nocardia sp. NPDC058640]|uniref:MFS transporter n=1 Tax=Nocardia sp. NPDC058640 TaxID=3346571 RepID=UPI00364BF55F
MNAEVIEGKPARLVLALALVSLVIGATQTVLLPIMPVVAGHFGSTEAVMAWGITAPLLVAAVATPLITRYRDLNGGRSGAVLSALALAIGSVISAMASSVPQFIVGRALTGASSALLAVVFTIISTDVDSRNAPKAFTLVSTGFTLGTACGFAIPGLTSFWAVGFRMPLIIVALGCFVALAAILKCVPKPARRALRESRRLKDPAGVVLLAAGMPLLILGLTIYDVAGIIMLVSGCAVIAAWIAVELRHGDPLVPLRVVAVRDALPAHAAAFVTTFALYVTTLSVSSVLQAPTVDGGFGWSMGAAGWIVDCVTIGGLVLWPFLPYFFRRLGPHAVLSFGLGMGMIGAIMCLGSMASILNVFMLLLGISAVGIGMTVTYAAMPPILFNAVPPESIGAASGISTVIRAVSGAAGSAVTAAVLNYFPLRSAYIGLLALTAGLSGGVAIFVLGRAPRWTGSVRSASTK